MNKRIRVINTLHIGAEQMATLAHLSHDFDIVHQVVPDTDIDTYDDGDAEILLAMRPPRSREHMPRLRWTQVASAGVENVVTNPLVEKGLIVTNARGVYSNSMAEYALWAVLDHNQKGPARRALQQQREWPEHKLPVTGRPLRDQTALIVGYGTIGREVARLLAAFGVRIFAVKARPETRADDSFHVPGTGDPEGAIPERIAPPTELATLAAGADMLISTLPITPESNAIVSSDVLHALPQDSLVVNVGRGATIDEPGLLAALDGGHVGAAYLDVFSTEPLDPGHPFWSHPKVTVTTHVSGGSSALVFDLFADNLHRFATGAQLINLVSPARGY